MEDIDRLIDRLESEGRARRQRGKYLVWVDDWGSLTHEEQELIREARIRKQRQLSSRRSSPRGSRAERRRRAARERAEKIRKGRKRARRERKYGYLVKVEPPEAAARWQKAAWWEARREVTRPSFGWAIGAAVVGWFTGLLVVVAQSNLIWLPVAGLAAWGLCRGTVELAIYRPYRMRVNRLARELLQVFEEARRRSRRIPDALREQVMERDGRVCVYCGADEDLHIDHIHPHSRGGLTVLDNLQVLCGPCNIRKGTRRDEEARKLLGG